MFTEDFETQEEKQEETLNGEELPEESAEVQEAFEKGQLIERLETAEKQNKRKKRVLILLMLLLLLVSIGVPMWYFWYYKPCCCCCNHTDFDKYSHQIKEDNEPKMQQPKGGGAVNLRYSNKVEINLSQKKAYLYFGNPSKSNQDVVLELYIGETLIAGSGRIAPGYEVAQMDIPSISGLSEKIYDGVFKLGFYNPGEDEKAKVNTNIPVTITCKKN